MTATDKAKQLLAKLGKAKALVHAKEVIKIEMEWKRKCLIGATSVKYDEREQSILDYWIAVEAELTVLNPSQP